ncbi:hypothetical protein K2173_020527 [Erythroxylum novogranatense]|uniref:Uncharacterized protein n=1 Tax=Erythroxylum novogranatense TaxID=1862640 RepID=A0AAV8TGS4_9ROSI|nr:hypothetical protein K2173_020527 [Erythroxylum novogranatense]
MYEGMWSGRVGLPDSKAFNTQLLEEIFIRDLGAVLAIFVVLWRVTTCNDCKFDLLRLSTKSSRSFLGLLWILYMFHSTTGCEEQKDRCC